MMQASPEKDAAAQRIVDSLTLYLFTAAALVGGKSGQDAETSAGTAFNRLASHGGIIDAADLWSVK